MLQAGNTNRSLERIGPGWMLMCSLVYFVCVTASNCWFDIGLLSALLVCGSLLLGMRVSEYLKALKSAWYLIAIAAVFHSVFRIWFVLEQDQSLIASGSQTLFFVIRLLLLIIMTSLVLRTHSPAVYAEAIALKSQFIFGRRNASHASQTTMLAFSMLPQIQEHMVQRKLARRLRGLTVGKSKEGRLAYARAELSAAFHFALDYANVVATVLWSRGFRYDRPIRVRKSTSTYKSSISPAITFCILCLCTLLPPRTN